MPRYLPRVVDAEFARLLAAVPAIVVDGPKAVGKTHTARQFANSFYNLADFDQREIVRGDRALALSSARPVLLDEWHLEPGVWEAARSAVNDEGSPGMFILTGSANPRDIRTHSGTGRFLRTRMRPMALAERGVLTPSVSLGSLLAGERALEGATDFSLADLIFEIAASGFPGIRLNDQLDRDLMLRSYVQTALEIEVPQLGFVPRRPHALLAWLRAYAAAVSTTASFTAIADAIPQDQRPTKVTTGDYREVLSQLWLLEQVPSFALSNNSLNELGKAPKHQLCDPALALAALGISGTQLRENPTAHGPLLGRLFESLATLSVRVYAQANGMEVSHVRTVRGEREIDLIATAPDGRSIAFEVKLSQSANDEDVRHLNWLRQKMGDQLLDSIVLTSGSKAYRRVDGVGVVPLALLGA
jgi:predicted AAA+ superfamily ATPase